MEFAGLQKTSLIDFPDQIATVVFTPGCNLRCPFCHNWRLVLTPRGPFLSDDALLDLLASRRQYVQAVVITGGEPTLHPMVPQFLKTLKERGYATKIDTNGFFPEVLQGCLPYVDYVALDIKTSIERYPLLGAETTDPLLRTIALLKDGQTEYECRSTVVPGFVDDSTIRPMGAMVTGMKRFVFQQFVPGDTLDPALATLRPHSPEIITQFANVMRSYVAEVMLRF